MALLDVTAVNVAVPSIQSSLGADVRGLSWVIDGYTLTFASLLLVAGGLGDRLGAKRVFTGGLAVFTLASILCGIALGPATLVLARILQGVGAALFMPSSLSLLRHAYPDARDRAQAIGTWSALTAITGACGPLFGGLLVDSLGWRSIFLLNVPVGLLAIAMTLRFVATSPSGGGRRGYDLPAQLTGAFALAAFTWALIERSALGWGSARIQLALVLAALGVLAFIILERRSRDPILPLHLFSNRTFSATAAAALLYAGAFFGIVFVLSLYFQQVRGDKPGAAGLHLTTISISFGLTSLKAGRLAARHGTRAPILWGLSALAAGAWTFALLPQTAPFAFLAVPLLMTGFGAGLVAPSMNTAILASVPPGLSGIGGGVLNASRQVGTAFGVALFASLFHANAPMAAVRISLAWAGALYLVAFALSVRAEGHAVLRAGAPAQLLESVEH
jgi:DHA2 family methylenomycin A resistance protein-like MFS transporter